MVLITTQVQKPPPETMHQEANYSLGRVALGSGEGLPSPFYGSGNIHNLFCSLNFTAVSILVILLFSGFLLKSKIVLINNLVQRVKINA